MYLLSFVKNLIWPPKPTKSLTIYSKSQLSHIASCLNVSNSGSKHNIINNLLTLQNSHSSSKTASKSGYIYIVSTDTTNPLKVGRTKSRPTIEEVGKYLYRRYRTAYGPNVAFLLYKSKNTYKDEKIIHTHLSPHRIGNSELFSTSLSKIKSICHSTTKSTPITYSNPKN